MLLITDGVQKGSSKKRLDNRDAISCPSRRASTSDASRSFFPAGSEQHSRSHNSRATDTNGSRASSRFGCQPWYFFQRHHAKSQRRNHVREICYRVVSAMLQPLINWIQIPEDATSNDKSSEKARILERFVREPSLHHRHSSGELLSHKILPPRYLLTSHPNGDDLLIGIPFNSSAIISSNSPHGASCGIQRSQNSSDQVSRASPVDFREMVHIVKHVAFTVSRLIEYSKRQHCFFSWDTRDSSVKSQHFRIYQYWIASITAKHANNEGRDQVSLVRIRRRERCV